MSRLSQPPETLLELGEGLKLLENLQGDLSKTESQIPPIHEQFAILEKYEVTVEREVSVAEDITDSKHTQLLRNTNTRKRMCFEHVCH